MPYIIGDNGVQTVTRKGTAKKTSLKPTHTPGFFNKSVLTGDGGKRGLLTSLRNPANFPVGYPAVVNPNMNPSTQYNGNTKIHNIPFYIIKPKAWTQYIKEFNRPDFSEMIKIATRGNESVYMTIPIHAIQVEETKSQLYSATGQTSGTSSITRNLSANFHMFLFFVNDTNNMTHLHESSLKAAAATRMYNSFYEKIIDNMFEPLKTMASDLKLAGFDVDKTAINDYVQNYSLYVEICNAAKRFETQIDYFLGDVFAKNLKNHASSNMSAYSNPWTGSIDESLASTLTRLEKYSIPLNMFQSLYVKLKSTTTKSTLTAICKSNLNLMLSDTLQHMHSNKAKLKYCPCNTLSAAQNCPSDDPRKPGKPYSSEQRAAITSTSPLTLVQSGAGTGKSTIILGRINHMIANGIDPKDILVLSFTNNAANHILDMNPDINSMTIDKMMTLIYSKNYPDHQLSSISTIIYSLEICYNTNTPGITSQKLRFITSFQRILQRLRDDLEFTNAINFIEDNIDEVIDALNTIQQTSLELQSIICYIQMETLAEPDEVKAEHLIIDEVQDNSIPQFIYSIKYTDKHLCSMYIVGDCSQTLYEFRASNPKALNMLEGSGVFSAFKLQTNYRSNQEILDFANITLLNIEANQFAKIQLKANNLAPVTYQSFTDKVKFHYSRMQNKSELAKQSLFAEAAAVTMDYIMDKLMKGEQIALLAHKRQTLNGALPCITRLIPNAPVIDPTTKQPVRDSTGAIVMEPLRVASLVPNRQYDNTIFSKFIAKYWNQVNYAPPTGIWSTISTLIYQNLPNIAFRQTNMQKLKTSAQRLIDKFEDEYGSRIKALERDTRASIISQNEMLYKIRNFMLNFEIKENKVAQGIMSSRNASAKESNAVKNAHIIVSTIHSAKGLEFDNVVLFYESESESSIEEATKRMYYVALTRAKKSEFIFAFDTLAKPKIGSDYKNIVDQLAANEKKMAKAIVSATANGVADSDKNDIAIDFAESTSTDDNNDE